MIEITTFKRQIGICLSGNFAAFSIGKEKKYVYSHLNQKMIRNIRIHHGGILLCQNHT